jgi:hypothetical protein
LLTALCGGEPRRPKCFEGGGARGCIRPIVSGDELRAYEQAFENHGYGLMPLWLTDFGWPGITTPTTALSPSFHMQARHLSEAYDDLLGLPFVEAAFVFNLEDYSPGIVSLDPTFFYHCGAGAIRVCPEAGRERVRAVRQGESGALDRTARSEDR